jgi:hypothetical protein
LENLVDYRRHDQFLILSAIGLVPNKHELTVPIPVHTEYIEAGGGEVAHAAAAHTNTIATAADGPKLGGGG